jgi:ATP-dependent DNA ligase
MVGLVIRRCLAIATPLNCGQRVGAPYRSGQSRDWLKIKNPDSLAMIRAREVEW